MNQNSAAHTATLDKIVATIGELPASPAVVSAVMGLTSDLNSNITDITRVLSADQSLTAKVLKLSNSSYYGRSKEVGTLPEAIVILGFFTVRSLVIASSAHALYSARGACASHANRLWHHSLFSGIAARQVALQIRRADAEELFIAGLLHDIGKLVLMQKLGEPYRDVIDEVERSAGEFCTVERRLLGFDHCDVGLMLLEYWSFPNRLVKLVKLHHDTRFADPDLASIVHVVQAGNDLAKHLGIGFFDHGCEDPYHLKALQDLGLPSDQIDPLIESIRAQFESEAGIFANS